MKRNKIVLAAAFSFAAFGLNSCLDYDVPTDDFKPNEVIDGSTDEDLHGNPDVINFDKTVTEEEFDAAKKDLDQLLAAGQTGQKGMRGGKEGNYPGEHAYQRQYTLADVYAEYAVVPHYDFAYAKYLDYSYSVVDDWYGGPNGEYGITRTNIAPLLNHESIDAIPEMKAIYLLMFDYSSIEIADLYGPMPFTAFLNNQDQPPFPFEAQSDVYKKVFTHLERILACLHHFTEQPEWYQTKVLDLMHSNLLIVDKNATVDTWIRFANSLKLRMAIHMVKVEPDLAKQYAEAAVADGVIESLADQVGFYPSQYSGSHPLYTISETWNDERLNASFESILMSLKHPYANALYEKNGGQLGDLAASKKTVGIRSGVRTGAGQSASSNPFINYSRLRPTMIQKAPLYIFKWSEIDFLRAEGALRGWNMGGTAQFFYERGIDNSSCLDPGSSAHTGLAKQLANYKNLASAVDYTYVDPLGKTESMPSVTKIGVKWNEADDKETKLEKIITQKYIAIFPNSFEAWGEMRRTGYPKTFPVLNPNQGDGSLKYGELVRRMIFPYSDDASIVEIQKTGLPALSKDNPQSMGDKQGTRVWWDRPTGNF